MAKGNNGDFMKKVQDFMRGRNGSDEISVMAAVLILILIVIDVFAKQTWISFVLLALSIYIIWRNLSTNVSARKAECRAVMSKLGPARRWLSNPKAAAEETREYKHVSCTHCGQRVRVPRGKGLLRVTCPKCGQKFEVRS